MPFFNWVQQYSNFIFSVQNLFVAFVLLLCWKYACMKLCEVWICMQCCSCVFYCYSKIIKGDLHQYKYGTNEEIVTCLVWEIKCDWCGRKCIWSINITMAKVDAVDMIMFLYFYINQFSSPLLLLLYSRRKAVSHSTCQLCSRQITHTSYVACPVHLWLLK